MTHKSLTRRRFMVAALSATGASAILAACSAPTPAPVPTAAPAQPKPVEPTKPAEQPKPAEPTKAPATAVPSAPKVSMTYLQDDGPEGQKMAKALADAYMAKNPNVTIKVESRPQGGDGDNLVKTKLATGDMADVFSYNSGSLLQALKPAQTLVDLTKEPYMANVIESFIPTVSQNGAIYGVPIGTATGGGIMYNKKVYAQLSLQIPKTWAEFAANNEKIKAAGITPVIGSFGPNSTWTSQLFVLADYHNVQAENPNFAADYTANKVKYATNEAAGRGFKYLEEANRKGWYQKDYATTTFDQAIKLLAEGKGAHYPMLTFALGAIAGAMPDKIADIGFFGQPGVNADKVGATIWMPAGTYIPKTSKNIDEAKKFLGFIASIEGVAVQTAANPPTGPYLIKGAKLPDTVLPGVKDVAAYIDAGKSTPALEFMSPVKGPALEQICIGVGSGQIKATDGATQYDKDVEKQAKQLGLPGW